MANDEPVYHGLALRLLNGQGFTTGQGFTPGLFTYPDGTPTAWRTPGLPAALAAIYWIAGDTPALARIVLALASSLTAPVLYSLGLRLFERRSIALIAGLGCAVLLNSRERAASLLPEPLAALLLAVAVLATVFAERRRSAPLAALAGLLLAYAVLTRGFLILVMIGPLAWLVVQRSRRLAAAMLIAVTVILGAWGLRNELRVGVFTLTTQTQELWQGNNAWARGSFPADWPPQRAYLLAKYPDLDELDEVRRSRLFVREAIDEVVSHPARILWLLPRKALVFFSHASYLGADWLYAGLLPFSLLGALFLATHRDHRAKLWLLGFPVVGVLLICLLVFGDPRFRIPVDPLIVVLASVGLHGLASQLGIREGRRAHGVRTRGARGRPDAPVVLYVSYDGALEPIGQSQILPYLEGLSWRGVEFVLLTFEKPRDVTEGSKTLEATRARLAAAGIRWVPLCYHKRALMLFALCDLAYGAVWVLRLVHRHRAQILHVRSYVPAAMAMPARWLLGCPVVFDIRGFWVDERVEGGGWRRGVLYRVAKLLEPLLYRSADAIVSLTEAGKLAIPELSGVSSRSVPITVIPTCVDTDRFAPRKPDRALTEQLGYEGKTVLTYAGSVGTWYALDEVLDFFGVVLEEIPNAALLLIIRGPVETLRGSVERRGLRAVTTIVCSATNGEIPEWLSVSHAGLAFYRRGVSNTARFPTKIGEYLASGLPIVVSGGVGDCDQILEVERVGATVREFTVPEYRRVARTLRELLRDDALGERCRNVALRRLSLAEGVQRYHALYRHLADGRCSA